MLRESLQGQGGLEGRDKGGGSVAGDEEVCSVLLCS